MQKEDHAGHLPTGLKGLDEALCGGIPFGVLTELVGPAGIGKTQVCFSFFHSVFVFVLLLRSCGYDVVWII